MTVYLAASWLRREEMREIREQLVALGVQVQSRWLDEQAPTAGGMEKFWRENALADIADVRAADMFVRFTDDLSEPSVSSRLATGARFFEMGLAFSLGKPIVVVGGYQCLFDSLPNVVHVRDAGELKRFLSPQEIN